MLEVLSQWAAIAPPGLAQIIGIWVAALLTCAVLSYILGQNVLFRLAEHLFVGIAAGYAAALAWNQVLWPRVLLLWREPYTYWYYGVFFVLGALLLARGIRVLSPLANLPLGVLLGTGSALALGGALTGSLVPQLRAAIVSVSPAHHGGGLLGWAYAVDALILVLGTIAVLSAFHFTAQGRGPLNALGHRLLKGLGGLGRVVIMITFGALMAGALLTFFAVLHGRLLFLLQDWLKLVGQGGPVG